MKNGLNTSAFVLALLITAAAGEELSLRASDDSTVRVYADRILKSSGGRINADGTVDISHGDINIKCVGNVNIYRSGDRFSTLMARGVVEATCGDKRGWCRSLFYDESNRLLTLLKKPAVQEGKIKYSADKKILWYTETGVIKCEPKTRIVIDRTIGREEPKQKRRKFLGIF